MSDLNLDGYEEQHHSVEHYLDSDESPIDYKMSPSDSAIERRQKNKRGRTMGNSVAKDPSDQTHHQTKIADPGDWESVSQRVNERRNGKVHTEVESEDDGPVDWS